MLKQETAVDVNMLVKQLGGCGVPLPLINQVMAIEVARMALLAKVESAHIIIDTLVRDLPLCSCHDGYVSRGLRDPSCVHCSDIGDDVYQTAVRWRDDYDARFFKPNGSDGSRRECFR